MKDVIYTSRVSQYASRLSRYGVNIAQLISPHVIRLVLQHPFRTVANQLSRAGTQVCTMPIVVKIPDLFQSEKEQEREEFAAGVNAFTGALQNCSKLQELSMIGGAPSQFWGRISTLKKLCLFSQVLDSYFVDAALNMPNMEHVMLVWPVIRFTTKCAPLHNIVLTVVIDASDSTFERQKVFLPEGTRVVTLM